MKTPEGPKLPTQVGHRAEAAGHDLHSYRVGLLPILNRILERGTSQSVSLELDTSWDQVVAPVGVGIPSRSQNR